MWSELITKEFYRQGDMEKQRQLPVSPFCDRDKDDIIQSQTGFFSYVVLPFFEVATTLICLDVAVNDQVQRNAEHWSALAAESKSPESAPPQSATDS
mmetsp:Transcript_28501/g.61619  ORF Transcript_28501/g.61619 Transcript_28501/m.61619 type:complete len:97 (+) Transcript_28501:147-437(+)